MVCYIIKADLKDTKVSNLNGCLKKYLDITAKFSQGYDTQQYSR